MDQADPPKDSGSERDPWLRLGRHTAARIALGRAGGSLRTRSLLDFRLAHARARDAVHAPFNPDRVEAELAAAGLATARFETAAADREAYLARPDLGRRLSAASRERLDEAASRWGKRDAVVILSDGLAAEAAERHGPATAIGVARLLQRAGWSLHPVLIVPFARVKLQDEVGAALGVRHSLILLGERPGLSAPDSLGAYLTCDPGPERTDADRNCISNIRPEGLPPEEAVDRLAGLLIASRRLGASGLRLNETDSLGDGRVPVQ